MKKSYLHALAAFGYIAALVTFINFNKIENGNELATGITMLSIFVFSAALMGYIFVAKPVLMYLDGKKQESVKFFLETLVTFGILALITLITAIIF